MNIREMMEKREAEQLAPWAQLSINSKGRKYPEKKCEIRTDFQRDRDRILYSKAFRRLKHKTQVFIAPENDYLRTRLTHTLEVAQISRSIARALKLNEDLTEAIALGHDLGHAPFGHAGEAALDQLMRRYSNGERFRHNEQSLRVVEYLEGEHGLNLTYEVKDGILKHTKGRSDLTNEAIECEFYPVTAEGAVVRLADRMAYVNHDMDDALRAKFIHPEELPSEAVAIIGTTTSERIGSMVTDVIENSLKENRVVMSSRMCDTLNLLKEFLFQKVYSNACIAKLEEVKAKRLIEGLFEFYIQNPEKLPKNISSPDASQERKICDYIAGMSDSFAIKIYNDIFIPKFLEIHS